MSFGNPTLNLVEDHDDACDFMRWLGERRKILAVDTETGGLQWWRDPLRLVQFGDLTSGWAVSFEEWGGLIKDALHRYEGDIVMHNCKFDLRYLERFGCAVKRSRVHDTRVMGHLLDPASMTGLKPMGVRYVDPLLDASQSDLKTTLTRNKWTWATVPWDFGPYWSYGALDTVITAHLYEQLWPLVRGRYEATYELEMASTLVIMDLETRGVRIDLDYCERRYEELSAYVVEMADWIKDSYGCSTSDRNVAARLLADGVILTARTETGQWKMDKEVLEGIDHPLAADTLARKKAQKIANTYFRRFLVDHDNGLLHPDVNPLGARTSRMSVTNPALQTLPRGRIVRDAFIPRDGHQLVDIDYDQVEQRLTAHFSGDQGMIDAFAEADAGGADFFTSLARRIYGDSAITKDDQRRQTSKNAAYGKVYGAGTESFAKTAGIDLVSAQQFLDTYDATFPGVKAWQREVERVGRERLGLEGEPYIITAWGRRLPADDDKLYTLANYLIQGTAADLLKQKLVDLESAGLASYLVMPVHDELLFDIPQEDVEDLVPQIEQVMRETERFTVPLTASAEVGASWGAIH